METKASEFQIFVKPVGPACNLSCGYCYYLDKKELLAVSGRGIMTDKLLELYLKQHIEASDDNLISFSWHGGEPLLAGIEFYEKVIKIQQRLKPDGKVIINGIQTNGTLLDDSWCRFLSENAFSVGISIDGPASLHNRNRRTKDGHDTFHKAIEGLTLIQMYGLNPEILCVVSSVNEKYPLEVYRFFRKLGAEYLTFLPLVEPNKNTPSGISGNSVNSLQFGLFLSEIFDEWLENDIGKIKVQIFEETARVAFSQEHTLCIFKLECGRVPVVEHNGDFFSCDHYVTKEFRLGNIEENKVSYFLKGEKQKEFGRAKLSSLPAYCIDCSVRSMCNGECPKNRIILTADGQPGLNYLCEGYKYFFSHCRPFIDALAAEWKNHNNS